LFRLCHYCGTVGNYQAADNQKALDGYEKGSRYAKRMVDRVHREVRSAGTSQAGSASFNHLIGEKNMYKHVLLPLDGSELSLKAVSAGIDLAKAVGAKVTFISVVPHFRLAVSIGHASEIVRKLEKEHEEEARKHADELLAKVETEAKKKGVPSEHIAVVDDSPYEQIIAHADKANCDLIVMASHGRRGLDAVLLGSETTKVLTHSKIPVLVVR
jgi:nucleotide-binding universal stress UspA family protein